MIRDDGDSEIETFVALFTILVVDIGAATLIEYQRGVRFWYMVAYVMVGIITLWPMMYMLNRTKRNAGGDEVFTHDRTSVVVGKWLTSWATVAIILFAGLGFNGRWLGQRPLPITISDISYVIEDAAPAARLRVVIRPENFGGGLPSDFDLLMHIGNSVGEKWHPVKAEGFRVAPESSDTIPQTVRLQRATTRVSGVFVIKAREFAFNDSTYRFYIYLRPWDGKAHDRAEQLQSDVLASAAKFKDLTTPERTALEAELAKTYQDDITKLTDETMIAGDIRFTVK